jgi:hypothetical protein
MLQKKNWGRDLLFAIALLALIKNRIDQCSQERRITPPKKLSRSSLSYPPTSNTTGLTKQEQQFVEQFNVIKKHIKKLEHHIEHANYSEKQLQAMSYKIRALRKELDTIYHKFFKLSPATLLLGPIGAASSVMKERQLTLCFLKAINTCGGLVYECAQTSSDTKTAFKPAEKIEEGIENNNKLVALLP